jgi:hypothetical protein
MHTKELHHILCTRQTSPWALQASCTVDTVSLPGLKLPGRGVYHSSNSARRLRKVRAIPVLPFGLSWPVLGELNHCMYSRTLDCEQLGLPMFYKTSKNFEGILT